MMILQLTLLMFTLINVKANQCSLEKPPTKEISSLELTDLIRNYVHPQCFDFTNFNNLCRDVENAMPRLRKLYDEGTMISFLDSKNFLVPFWNIRECFTLYPNFDQCQPRYEDFEVFLKHKKHNVKANASKLDDNWTLLERSNDPNYVPRDDCECQNEKKKEKKEESSSTNKTEAITKEAQKQLSNSSTMQKFQKFRDRIIELMGKELKLMQLIMASKDKRHDKLKEFVEILGHYQDGLDNFKSLIDLNLSIKPL